MRKINIQYILLVLVLVLLVNPVFAQENNEKQIIDTIQFGEYTVEYNNREEISQSHTAYKKGGRIVLSVFDIDENGKDDLWLRYNENFILDLEASDTTGDGQADTFVSLDVEEQVTDLKSPEFVLEEIRLPKDPGPKQKVIPAEVNELEVFKLSPLPTKNKFSLPLNWIFAVIVIGGIALYKWKSKKKI
ncbi:hypothetical protein KAR28_00840 [Candidatus Parcubacteria bacterium]|nr:hypothetical protein [Candidatus Parcubacteria bacterium]